MSVRIRVPEKGEKLFPVKWEREGKEKAASGDGL